MDELRLSRDALGRLVYTAPDGTRYDGVVPIRAFPLTAPEAGLALVGAQGEEVVWIADPATLAAPARELLAAELASREFTPEITRIRDVSSFATPSTWQVDTDHGPTALVLRGEEDIRRLGGHGLLITDKHGIHYLVRDPKALDKKSRRLLDRFL